MPLALRIQLAGITKPPVWRRLAVPDHFSFHRFHLVIQAAFGWQDSHLYQFSEKGHGSDWSIAVPSDDDRRPVKNSRKIKLADFFNAKRQTLVYLYDFGDDWLHNITLEDMTESSATTADCIAGKGACPPEDCGGPWGYENLKEVVADPKHPEHKALRKWLGLQKEERWIAAAFDLPETKRLLHDL